MHQHASSLTGSDGTGLAIELTPTGLHRKYEARYRTDAETFADAVLARLPLHPATIDVAYVGVEKQFADEMIDRAERGDVPFRVERFFYQWTTFLNDDDVRKFRRDEDDPPRPEIDIESTDIGALDDLRRYAARQKAFAAKHSQTATERYDELPDVNFRVLLHDGTDSDMNFIYHGRGLNGWFDNSGGAIDGTIDLNLSDHVLHGRYKVDTGQATEAAELTDDELRQLTPEQRTELGLDSDDDITAGPNPATD